MARILLLHQNPKVRANVHNALDIRHSIVAKDYTYFDSMRRYKAQAIIKIYELEKTAGRPFDLVIVGKEESSFLVRVLSTDEKMPAIILANSPEIADQVHKVDLFRNLPVVLECNILSHLEAEVEKALASSTPIGAVKKLVVGSAIGSFGARSLAPNSRVAVGLPALSRKDKPYQPR